MQINIHVCLHVYNYLHCIDYIRRDIFVVVHSHIQSLFERIHSHESNHKKKSKTIALSLFSPSPSLSLSLLRLLSLVYVYVCVWVLYHRIYTSLLYLGYFKNAIIESGLALNRALNESIAYSDQFSSFTSCSKNITSSRHTNSSSSSLSSASTFSLNCLRGLSLQELVNAFHQQGINWRTTVDGIEVLFSPLHHSTFQQSHLPFNLPLFISFSLSLSLSLSHTH